MIFGFCLETKVNKKIRTEDMELKTTRLRLRPILSSDLEAMHNLHSIPEVDYYNTLGIPKDLDHSIEVLAPLVAGWEQEVIEKYTFVIELLEANVFLGIAALNLRVGKYNSGEIWYKLNPSFWNKGYATEAVKAILKFGFQNLKLHRIEAGCAIENLGSVRVLEKIGMKREGQKRKTLPLKKGWSDNYEYSILEEEYESLND